MRQSTMVGLVAAGAVGLAAGGVALAARGQAGGSRPPYAEYRVKSGDTLSALGLRFFGDASKWPALLDGQAKPFSMMEALPIGVALRVPCRWHIVKRGETLAKIAQDELGNSGQWKRIAELNRDRLPDPNKLEVGMVIGVPVAVASTPEPAPSVVTVSVGGLDFLGEDKHAFVGKGGGRGGNAHGGHGHSGRRRRGGGGGWGGGPYWFGPAYADGIEVVETSTDRPPRM